MKFSKMAAIAASVLTLGFFTSCSDFSESEKTAIVIQLPGYRTERAAETTKEEFIKSLSYNVYLTKDTSTDYKDSESDSETFLSTVETFFKKIANAQMKTGSAGDTIEFRDIEEGSYKISIYYVSKKFSKFGEDSKIVSVKDGNVENVCFTFKYPSDLADSDEDSYSGYTKISSVDDINSAIANLSTSGVDYPNESTYTKFYLANDIEISSQVKISTPASDSYGILIDLNGHTVTGSVKNKPLLSVGDNTNIVFKNGTIKTSSSFVNINERENNNAPATVKFDGITATTAGECFTSQNNGIVIVTNGTTIDSASVSGGLFLMLGGTVNTLTQTTGSVAMIDSIKEEDVTFKSTGANTIKEYKTNGSEWMLLYFGGNATVKNKISVTKNNINNLKFIQMSKCTSERVAELSFDSENEDMSSNSPVLFTKCESSPYKDLIMTSPETDKIVLPSGYSFSETVMTADTCAGYKIVKN